MAIIKSKPTTPGRRFRTSLDRSHLSAVKPHKRLLSAITRLSGRAKGTVTIRHRGGGAKRRYRTIDFKRDKRDIAAVVASVEYDPNRTADIALLHYVDGEKRYILAPAGLTVGSSVISSDTGALEIGNTLPLRLIAPGVRVHNVELIPGHGGQLARSAGVSIVVVGKEGKYVQVRMPSGEKRLLLGECHATIGQLGNADLKNMSLGKAGRQRHLRKRPTVRGVAMFPAAHPHGGGEAKSKIGMKHPKTPWGKPALGKKTRRRKNTTKYILQRRNSK